MKPIPSNSKKRREWEMTPFEFTTFKEGGYKFIQATLNHTMGPLWKDIYWLRLPDGTKRPYIRG